MDINYKKNLNFLHIAELLQEKSQFFHKKKYLIRWFKKKIQYKKQPLYTELVRNLDQSELVKIITIHKSKGLEYPIVWIPFSIDFHRPKLSVYHNQNNFKIFFDIEKNKKNLKMADKERLAEDLRFLYVALTRSILHCSIGIAYLIKKKLKNKNHSDIHLSALGYIIQNGKAMNYDNLLKKLNQLSSSDLIKIKSKTVDFILPEKKQTMYLIPKPNVLKKNINNTWNITSFTKLNQENKFLVNNANKMILEAFSIKDKTKKNKFLTIHNFPAGKNTGLLLHYILKNLNILNKKNYHWFSKILEKYEISKKWTKILMSWISDIINTPLYSQNSQKIILSKIKETFSIKELEFFLPIKKKLYHVKLNKIIQFFDPISNLAPKLIFNPVMGILKGFIDLVFFWEKKYYIIDYKSNWLGENNNFYSNHNIKKEIIKHRYDLQYQIYTVAINQYLTKKIKNYNYQTDFGGIFYIFLRGIKNKKNNGIFYVIPDYSLIKKLMMLMS